MVKGNLGCSKKDKLLSDRRRAAVLPVYKLLFVFTPAAVRQRSDCCRTKIKLLANGQNVEKHRFLSSYQSVEFNDFTKLQSRILLLVKGLSMFCVARIENLKAIVCLSANTGF